MKRYCGLSICLLFALSAVMRGQSAAQVAFDQADVRVSKPGTTDGGGFIESGLAEFRGATMLDLIAGAYDVEERAVIGGPSWLATDRFDITAKAGSSSPDATTREMLQALLAERFKLKTHREDRALPVYALAVGKRGPKLKEAKGSDAAGCNAVGGGGATVTWECHNMTMAALGERLHALAVNYVDRPVEDLTGLKGAYDFALSWTRRGQLRNGGSTAADSEPGANLTLFDALGQQLGLSLDAQTRMASVVVVDDVDEKPTDNPTASKRNPAPEPTEFEVASVHPSPPGGAAGGSRLLPSGQVELRGISLQELITVAYDIEGESLAGAPNWLDVDHFDIVAKAPSGTSPDALQAMLRSLLAERFKLVVHNEEQPVTVYALTVGKGDPKLKEASGSERSECKNVIGNGVRTVTCQNTTMAQLAERLRGAAPAYLDHPVVDLTGLKDAYDFALSWTPKARTAGAQGLGGDLGQPASGVLTASDPTGGLTPFEAVDKQLGLKLAAAKHPMPVVVIDHVERTPTEN